MKKITVYDGLPPEVAVAKAWSEYGSRPKHHKEMQDELRKSMPLLARALDRLVDTSDDIWYS